MATSDFPVVVRRLGARAANLYVDVLKLLDGANSCGERSAIGAIVTDLLCGTYHDYRSESGTPKADLAAALRALRPCSLDYSIGVLVSKIEAGEFDEDSVERRRYCDRVARDRVREGIVLRAAPQSDPTAPVQLAAREADVLIWLERYVKAYGKPPTTTEIAAGCSIAQDRISRILLDLERKGVAARVGGKRGWFATRAA